MLFGQSNKAPYLMKVLNIHPGEVPRFRDCFIQDGHIIIHTRTGGGNREYYGECNDENQDGPWNSDLEAHEFYVDDEDDDFDSTYANFKFSFPPDYAEDLKAMEANTPEFSPSEKWKLLFESMDSEITKNKESK